MDSISRTNNIIEILIRAASIIVILMAVAIIVIYNAVAMSSEGGNCLGEVGGNSFNDSAKHNTGKNMI